MEQIKDVEICLVCFENFMRVATQPESKQESLRALSQELVQKEADADASLRRMIDSLLHVSFLPSTKEELIDIASSCDRVANKCEHTAVLLVVQKFRFPAEYEQNILDILGETIRQFELLQKSISMLFSEFGAFMKDHSILDQIRECESKVDRIEQKLYEDVFSNDMDLAHQTQLARFIELVCDVSDIIENIADKIQVMLITRKM